MGKYLQCSQRHWFLHKNEVINIPPEIERKKKKKKQIVKRCKKCGISITIQYNLKLMDVLDVTLL